MEITWKRTGQLLLIIGLLSAVLRFADLGANSFVADEFLDINSSYGYAQTGAWQAWDFNFSRPAETNLNAERDERAFVYKWQVAQVLKFLPPTEGVARSVSALWGIASVFIIFWSAWIFTRRKDIGLLAAFLCAVSISAIVFDRRLRMYAMFFPVFLILATVVFAFFEREYQGSKKWLAAIQKRYGLNALYALPAVFFFGLALMVHQLSASIIPIVGLYLALMAWREWQNGRALVNKYFISLSAGLGVLLVALIFFSEKVRSFTGGLTFFEDHYSYFGHILSDFAHPLLGLTLVIGGAFFLGRRLGFVRESWFLSLSAGVPLLMAVFLWNRNAGEQYIFFAQSFVMILAAAGIAGILNFMKQENRLFGKRAVYSALALALLLTPAYGYFLMENNTYHETSSSTNPNYRKIFGYFKKQHQDGEVLITRNFRNYYWSGMAVPVMDFGGELTKDKLTPERLQAIVQEHPAGWFIASGNDMNFVSGDIEEYIVKNWERVSNDQVRGDILVYRWGVARE